MTRKHNPPPPGETLREDARSAQNLTFTETAKRRVVACPACGASVAWCETNTYRPFCSARCKGIDLGAWASEQYRVEAADEPEPADETPHTSL